MKKFPKGFLWGASTASFQVEGGIENNDWAQAARDGKVPPAGLACDHYNRYEEDFDIAKSLNHTSHRFSIEWARIEPEEGKFVEEEIEHYKKVVTALRARNIEPFVTLWHFTLPKWFSESGGFTRKDAPEIFARYCAYVVEKLGTDVVFYSTMNEPMVWVGNGNVAGIWPPFRKNFFNFLSLHKKLVQSHKMAFSLIKQINPKTKVGVTKNNLVFQAHGLLALMGAHKFAEKFWDGRFHKAIINHQDFVGINHYFRIVVGQKKVNKPCPRSDFGWELNPHTLYLALRELKQYQMPVFIMEHGLADAKDQYREWYITESLKGVHKAIQEGVDVRGYMHWSLLDNYEWAEGYKMRFGLVHVEHDKDQKRTVRESAKKYAEICKNNAV